MDGWLTLGTKLNTKQLEKDLKNTERELSKFEKEQEKLMQQKMELKAKLDVDAKPFFEKQGKASKRIAYLKDQLKQLEDMRKNVSAGNGKQYSLEMATFKIEDVKRELKELENNTIEMPSNIKKQLNEWENVENKIKENKYQQSLLKGQIEETNKKLKHTKGFDGLKKSIKDTEKGMGKIVKKVVKWGLAIFSIRSAYSFLRQSVSTLSQYDEEMAGDIERIRYALASTLEPVIKRIIDLVYKLLTYIRYIVFKMTGKDIFANANKNLQKANKEASKLGKQLASFDEMNILSDTSGGTGSVSPQGRDIPMLQEGEVPKWVQWIVDNGDTLLAILGGIAVAIVAMKLSSVAEALGLIGSHLTFLQGLGIVVFVLGIYEVVKNLKDIIDKLDGSLEDNNTTLEDWGKTIGWVGVAILGLALIIGSIPVAVAGALVAIFGLMMYYWDDMKKFITEKVFGWIDNNLDNVRTNFGEFGVMFITEAKRIMNDFMAIWDAMFAGVKQIFDGILLIFKGDFKNGFINIGKGILNILIGFINTAIQSLNTVVGPIRELIVAIGFVTGQDWTMDNIKIPTIPKLARGGIVNLPSRGVPVGSAIAGERGQEGVIPLTDSQQMELLGEAIGKYITINANIPVYVGNKQVAREIRKLNDESDFAYNR